MDRKSTIFFATFLIACRFGLMIGSEIYTGKMADIGSGLGLKWQRTCF